MQKSLKLKLLYVIKMHNLFKCNIMIYDSTKRCTLRKRHYILINWYYRLLLNHMLNISKKHETLITKVEYFKTDSLWNTKILQRNINYLFDKYFISTKLHIHPKIWMLYAYDDLTLNISFKFYETIGTYYDLKSERKNEAKMTGYREFSQ